MDIDTVSYVTNRLEEHGVNEFNATRVIEEQLTVVVITELRDNIVYEITDTSILQQALSPKDALDFHVERIASKVQFKKEIENSELVDHLRECDNEWLKDNIEEYDFSEVGTALRWISRYGDISKEKKETVQNEYIRQAKQ